MFLWSHNRIRLRTNLKRLLILLLICWTVGTAALFWRFTSLLQDNKASAYAGRDNSPFVKVYVVESGQKFSRITTTPDAQVTLRLEYDNPQAQLWSQAQLQATLPKRFTPIPGSLRNCYVDLPCVNLQDSLIQGSSLKVAPSAGYFGFPPDQQTGVLDMGRIAKLSYYRCTYRRGLDKVISRYQLGTLAASTYCLMELPEGYKMTQEVRRDLPLSGVRYISQKDCQYPSAHPYAIQDIDSTNAGNYFDDNVCPPQFEGRDLRLVHYELWETLGKRYLYQQQCLYAGSEFVFQTDKIIHLDPYRPDLVFACPKDTHNGFAGTPLTQSSVNVYDTWDAKRGYGYIELTLKAPKQTGCYGVDVSLVSLETSKLQSQSVRCLLRVSTDFALNSLSPKVVPANQEAWVTLQGSGFSERLPLRVQIQDQECTQLKVISDTQLECMAPPKPPGSYPVTLLPATGLWLQAEQELVYE